MLRWRTLVLICTVWSIVGFGQDEVLKNLLSPAGLTGAGFGIEGFSFLQNQDSVVAHIPNGVGDYCANWIKAVNTTPRNELPREFFPKVYRAVVCRPVEGKCQNQEHCSMSSYGPERPLAHYVLLPQNDLKFEKSGVKYEYEPEVEMELKDQNGIAHRGKYRNEKYAGLFKLAGRSGRPFWFCSIPVKVSSTGATEVPREHTTLSCRADQDTHKCPGLSRCLSPQYAIESHEATMAFSKSAPDSLALTPHQATTPVEQLGHKDQGI